MEQPKHAAPHSPWQDLVRSLPAATQQAFYEKFGHGIDINMDVKTTEGGHRTPVFSFTMAKPGLLPTAIERTWFDGYVLGFRQCCNQVLDMLDAATNEQRPS